MKHTALHLIAVIILLFSSAGRASAQFKFLQRLFEPSIFRVTDELRKYIRTELPPVTHDRSEEIHHIDMIYVKAMELSHKEVSVALLASAVAVLNRTDFKPTFPLLGSVVIPLPSENSADAAQRIAKLPRYFLSDSPQDKWGDSPKLVHFFGSAYLTYETGTKNLPDAIGKWIEEGEATFKLDSLGQQRDVFINRLGQEFGDALSEGRDVLPSDFLSTEVLKSQYDKIRFGSGN